MPNFRYMKIGEKILNQITTGDLAPGMPVPSTRELCAEYGVSHITAMRALMWLARRGILTHNLGKNYCVSKKFESHSDAGHFITLLFRYLSFNGPENYGNRLIAGVCRETSQASLGTYIASMPGQIISAKSQNFSRVVQEVLALSKGNRGFVADYYIPDEIIAELIEETQLPVVVIGRISQVPGTHSVVLGLQPAWQNMLNTIRRLSYTAYICCESGNGLRYEEAELHHLYQMLQTEQKCVILNNFDIISSAQRIEKLRDSLQFLKGERVAIFAPSDEDARSIINYLQEMNIEVPHQCGVVGFYGTRIARDFSPYLSCLSVTPESLGMLASQLIIAKDMNWRTHMIPMEFVFGETI